MASIPPLPLVPPPPASAAQAEAACAGPTAARAARIDWLFRDSVRQQVINPLHALMRAHSLKEGV